MHTRFAVHSGLFPFFFGEETPGRIGPVGAFAVFYSGGIAGAGGETVPRFIRRLDSQACRFRTLQACFAIDDRM